MTVTAPPRPPRPNDPVTHEEFDALVEAVIQEARQRGRRRRRRRGAMAMIVALVGAGLFAVLDQTVLSGNGSSALSEQSAFAATTPPKIAFTRSGFGGQRNGGLYIMNADGSGKQRLPGGARGNTPSWSPDGRKIAIGATVVNVDGSDLQALAKGTSPSWSPDGREIAFMRNSRVAGAWGPNVYVMNADGSEQRRLTRRIGGRPFWSPDGRRIAFANRQKSSSGGYVYPYRFDIYVMNADGGGLRRIAPTSFDSRPVWSPDGAKIAYVRNYDVWVMNADGSAQRMLTSGAGRDLSPSWSPDGQKIVFERRLGRRAGSRYGGASSLDIYVMNADGSDERLLAENGSKPLWSTDGKKIAFSRALGNGVGGPTFTSDNWEIFVMNADGTDQRNVTRNRQWDENAFAWAPAER